MTWWERKLRKGQESSNSTLLFDSLAQKSALMRERKGKDENLDSKI